MPVTVNVSHVSPLFSYIPRSAWYEPSTESDPDLTKYAFSGYHANNNTRSGNASVIFSWWGTDIQVHGGYRTWLGDYEVTLDGVTWLFSGFAHGAEEDFDYMLFNSTGLLEGAHHLRITNASNDPSRPTLDIDYVTFESSLEEGGLIRHTSSSCTWLPKGTWDVDEQSHSTENNFGKLELSFEVNRPAILASGELTILTTILQGSGFVLHGILDETSAPLTVTVDGQSTHSLTPQTSVPAPSNSSQVLFAVTSLLDGSHRLTVENNPVSASANAQKIAITGGRVLIAAPGNDGGPLTAASPSSGSGTSSHSSLIFAASFGALGAFFLAILIWRLVVRCRTRAKREHDLTVTRPFLARANPFADSSPRTPYDPYPFASRYAHTHSFSYSSSYAAAAARRYPTSATHARHHSRAQGRSEGNVPMNMSEPNPARCSISRMLRPGPRPRKSGAGAGAITITIPPRPARLKELELELEGEAYDPDAVPLVPPIPGPGPENADSGLGRARARQPTRQPTDATFRTSSSCTMCDSMAVHPPTSPALHNNFLTQTTAMSPPGLQSPTQPLRIRRSRRGSIEKPPLNVNLQLVGSPVASLPSQRSVVATLLSPPPVPIPPPPLPSSARASTRAVYDDYEVEVPTPPPYYSLRLMDLH